LLQNGVLAINLADCGDAWFIGLGLHQQSALLFKRIHLIQDAISWSLIGLLIPVTFNRNHSLVDLNSFNGGYKLVECCGVGLIQLLTL